jgi:hypothetical protein
MSDAPQQAGAPAKVLVLTAYDPPFAGLANLTVPRMRAFCQRHGYVFRDQPVSDGGLRPYWLKIAALRQALDEDHDLIVWIDVDAVILRLDADLRGALPPGKDLGMVWHGGETAMPNGVPAHFNNGIIIVRSGAWARDFFRRVAETRLKHYWHEQAAMLHLLGYDAVLGLGPDRPEAPDRQQVGRLDPAWNAIPAVATVADPIIHHWAGLAGPARERAIAADVAMLAFRDAHGDPARRAVAELMNRWWEETDHIAQLERRLRSPRLMLKAIGPAALARLRRWLGRRLR